MKILSRLGLGSAAAALAVAGFAGVAAATPNHLSGPGSAGAVFVQTDNPAGNQVVAYQREANGQLTQQAAYPTGGLGGQLAGSVVDHTASQGSLTLDRANHVLFAVNAGSNTLSVFSVAGDHLRLQQVVPSGGDFPVSVAVSGSTVYVLNALNGGSVQGFFELGNRLVALPWAHRTLGLNPAATPQYTTTPGQVAVSPDGRQLIVTTKDNSNAIDVFGVGPLGALSALPVVNTEPGADPFAVSFDALGHLVVAEAGPNAVASFQLHANGTLTELNSVPTGQSATCWVTTAQGYFYASNAGSNTVSSLASSPAGNLALLGTTGTDPGTVDAAATPNGQFLYVQTGGEGIVDAYQVHANGSLSRLGSVPVPDAVGGEGIVAS